MRGLTLLAGFVIAAAAASAISAAAEPEALDHRCKSGFRHAVIGGKHKCLKAGQRCTRRYDRQYHRYGFHCHSGWLTRRVANPPPPVEPPPPPSADLAITATDTPDPVAVGAPLTYTATITNNGLSNVDTVRVLFTASAVVGGVLLPSVGANCAPVPPLTVSCVSIAGLASGASLTLTLVVRAVAAGTLGLTVTVAPFPESVADPNSSNNTVALITAVTAAAPPPPPQQETATRRIRTCAYRPHHQI